MKFGLTHHTITKINHVFAQFPEIEQVVIYGSRAKGNAKPGSDIDLTLIGDRLTHQALLKISWMLDELMTPYLFDLSIYHQIENADLRAHIARVGVVFYP